MLKRIFIKNHLSFDTLELEFGNGLSVFTGASGAGKSVFMNAILSVFGLKEINTGIVEADIMHEFDMSECGILNETPNNFRLLKDKSARYFINSQMVSKKNLSKICHGYIKFLGAKDTDELSSENLLELLDILANKKNPTHKENLENFKVKFHEFLSVKSELDKILQDENKIEELKEFARFEIDKIEKISPKIGEYDELLDIKKRLSKKDKILELWNRAEQIFSYEKVVVDALNLSDLDTAFFVDCMNELRLKKESLNMDDLNDLDVEMVLDRIEALSGLNRRYGGIDEALKILDKRKKELEYYEKIEFEKDTLQVKFSKLSDEILALSDEISNHRIQQKEILENTINRYLKELYLNNATLKFNKISININGIDEIKVSIDDTEFKNLSSGETNRLRLAFIAASLDISGSGSGILILDEIDSNLSGKEAMSVAGVLTQISKFYQIFAISHQPQLSSKANHHFLVSKNGGISSIRALNDDEKVGELARMVSGEVVSKEALEFAAKLRENI